MKRIVLVLFVVIGIGFVVWPTASRPVTQAQTEPAPCGYVDGFDFPVPNIDTEQTDFGIYRPQFGGLHTGIDVAFEQLGAPVRAAARGRVTYSDTEGWGTEKGVVVIQHTFPDGTQVNTLYGHMEELNGHHFPFVDQCVERGDIVGAVGFPSQGRPHLHYEIRTRYRYEGGPGYTQVNPLELGWLHPVDFTYLARIWILPAYRQHFLLTERPALPLLVLSDHSIVIGYSSRLEGRTTDGQTVWQFDTLGTLTGLIELPDGRVLASTSANQILILSDGSYSALWQAPKALITPPILFGDAIVFMTEEQTLMALSPAGDLLWETPPMTGRAVRWAVSGDELAVGTLGGDLWIVDPTGAITFQSTYPGEVPLPFAAPEGEFMLLSGSTIARIDRDLTISPLVDTGHSFAPEAELLRDTAGTLYLYTGEGRSLYAYGPDHNLLWIAYMPGSFLRAPCLALGGGKLIYALTTDAQLLAYTTQDGRLVAQLALYDGGIDGSASARWLAVDPDDTVHFNGGYLSVVTLDGLTLLSSSS